MQSAKHSQISADFILLSQPQSVGMVLIITYQKTPNSFHIGHHLLIFYIFILGSQVSADVLSRSICGSELCSLRSCIADCESNGTVSLEGAVWGLLLCFMCSCSSGRLLEAAVLGKQKAGGF